MEVYQREIIEFKKLMRDYSVQELSMDSKWQVCDREEVLLRMDTAYELGGGTLPAVGGLAFTSDSTLVEKDRVFLLGKDLYQLEDNTPYARISIIRLSQKACDGKERDTYELLRRVDYGRYHVYPQGYMLRISVAKEKESARVSKEAVKQGISFSDIGACYAREYHMRPEVEAVETYFITDPDFPYDACQGLAVQCERITESLNHIFQGLSMDCGSCNLKEICDEVEGLRKLHQNESGKSVGR